MQTLERKPLVQQPEPDPIIAQAEESLGYSCGNQSQELRKALVKIGVQPFTKASVEKYKASKRTGDMHPTMAKIGVNLIAAAALIGLITLVIIHLAHQSGESNG
jgi:hypothetical protein